MAGNLTGTRFSVSLSPEVIGQMEVAIRAAEIPRAEFIRRAIPAYIDPGGPSTGTVDAAAPVCCPPWWDRLRGCA